MEMPVFRSVVVTHPAWVVASSLASQAVALPVTTVCRCGDGGGAAGFAGLESVMQFGKQVEKLRNARWGLDRRAGYCWQTIPTP